MHSKVGYFIPTSQQRKRKRQGKKREKYFREMNEKYQVRSRNMFCNQQKTKMLLARKNTSLSSDDCNLRKDLTDISKGGRENCALEM